MKDQVLYRPEFGQAGKTANEKIWELMSSYIGADTKSIQRSIINHVEYTLARTRFNFDNLGAYQATGYSVRDRLIEAWNDTQQYHTVSPTKLTCVADPRQQARLLLFARVSDGPYDAERLG